MAAEKQARAGFVGYTREVLTRGDDIIFEVIMDSSELLEHYKNKHSTDELSKGSSLFKHVPYLARAIKDYNINTVLDYGCGKAFWWNYNIIKLYLIQNVLD